jgi:hypothetical protein
VRRIPEGSKTLSGNSALNGKNTILHECVIILAYFRSNKNKLPTEALALKSVIENGSRLLNRRPWRDIQAWQGDY